MATTATDRILNKGKQPMNAWNFNEMMIVANYNWHWLAAALVLGLFVGWVTCRSADAG